MLDGSRIQSMLDQLHEIGRRPGGGVYRGVYDEAWQQARELIRGWMQDAGFDVREDAVGNLWGHVAGREAGPPVAAGSHFDSVPDGGKYDGPLGLVASIVAIEALVKQHGAPRRPLVALATCEEEGSRFHAGFWASRAILGRIEPADTERLRDHDGVTMAEALRGAGYDPARVGEAKAELAAFVELHVEQGPRLERVVGAASHVSQVSRPIGVVTAITGIARAFVTLRGQPDHAGTAPMEGRRDALLGLAEIAPALREQAVAAGNPAVLTIGQVEVLPGAPNVVPGEVRFTIDARHPDEATLRRLAEGAVARCREAAERQGLGCEAELTRLSPPVQCRLAHEVRAAAEAHGYRPIDIVSGAGHDAQALGTGGVPTGMIFVVSQGGRSHCPEEYSTPEDCLAGASVLAETLRRLAY